MPEDAQTYRLVTEPGGVELAGAARLATTFVDRLVGLMGRSALAPGSGVVFDSCRSIHTCFMRFAIDVVFVDGAWRVVRAWEHLKPWRVTPWVWAAQAAVELPAGTLQRARVRAGDRLLLQPVKQKSA